VYVSSVWRMANMDIIMKLQLFRTIGKQKSLYVCVVLALAILECKTRKEWIKERFYDSHKNTQSNGHLPTGS
jgi:hypothetical protein